ARLSDRDLRPAQRKLLAAYLAAATGERAAALRHLDGLDLGGAELLPLGRYLAFDLYQRLLAERDPERLLALYPALYDGPGLSRQTRLFYAYHYLARLARVHPERAERERRLAQRLDATDNEAIAELLHTERAALALAAAEGLQTKAPIYRDLRDRLTASKTDPLLRRVQHTRAIQILGAAGDYPFMERLSRHWLLVTPIEGMGFPHVAAQYAVTVKDQAYGLLADGETADAYNAFYGVLRQTDDLEAHYRYITLGSRRLERGDEVARSYRILRERDLLGHSDRYVRALRLLLRAGDDAEPARIKEAIAHLEDLPPTGASPAMGRLLLGYAHHRLLDADGAGGYDRARFEQAHHHYMLALDLAHDSTRIRAAVLQNLGFLHRQAGNHATAAAFYRRRVALPFADPVTEAAVRWQLARALFYVDRPAAAHDQAEAALAVAEAQAELPAAPFREKAAFYAVQAGAYQPALRHYGQLREAEALQGEAARPIQLGYGYALLKAGERGQARQVLSGLADTAAGDARLRLLTLGLWAEAADDPATKARLRRRRVALWRTHADNPRALGYDEGDRLAFLSKDLQQIAAAEAQRGRPQAAREAATAALAAARGWGETSAQPAGQPLYRALVNYLALAAEHPAAFAGKVPKGLEKAVSNARTALTEGPVVPPAARARALKLGLLWAARQGERAPGVLLETKGAQKLAEADPAAYRALETLARALTPSPP
ncbi:MAG TPA: hypothetical protein VJ985_02260, partial [Gammaproteobacteria bacterium]|nr:hypothetical protein [Gammaproteobacteria bacterium]